MTVCNSYFDIFEIVKVHYSFSNGNFVPLRNIIEICPTVNCIVYLFDTPFKISQACYSFPFCTMDINKFLSPFICFEHFADW